MSFYHHSFSLLQSNVLFEWNDMCDQAFNRIKELLISPPVLRSPPPQDHLIIETDASELGAGSCLKGRDPQGHEFLVAYNSYKFSPTECNWNIVGKEGYSLLHAIRRYRHYLIGTKFTARVDSRIITYICSKRERKNRRLLNWALELSEFDFDIIHIPGRDNAISDCLTRLDSRDKTSDSIVTITDIGTDMSIERWQELQQLDTEVASCIDYLKQGKRNFDVNKLGIS